MGYKMHFANIIEKNGKQTVLLPPEYKISAKKVKITQYGKGVLLEPTEENFETLINSLNSFTEDFMQNGRKNN